MSVNPLSIRLHHSIQYIQTGILYSMKKLFQTWRCRPETKLKFNCILHANRQRVEMFACKCRFSLRCHRTKSLPGPTGSFIEVTYWQQQQQQHKRTVSSLIRHHKTIHERKHRSKNKDKKEVNQLSWNCSDKNKSCRCDKATSEQTLCSVERTNWLIDGMDNTSSYTSS